MVLKFFNLLFDITNKISDALVTFFEYMCYAAYDLFDEEKASSQWIYTLRVNLGRLIALHMLVYSPFVMLLNPERVWNAVQILEEPEDRISWNERLRENTIKRKKRRGF